jgi:hypothetical protein
MAWLQAFSEGRLYGNLKRDLSQQQVPISRVFVSVARRGGGGARETKSEGKDEGEREYVPATKRAKPDAKSESASAEVKYDRQVLTRTFNGYVVTSDPPEWGLMAFSGTDNSPPGLDEWKITVNRYHAQKSHDDYYRAVMRRDARAIAYLLEQMAHPELLTVENGITHVPIRSAGPYMNFSAGEAVKSDPARAEELAIEVLARTTGRKVVCPNTQYKTSDCVACEFKKWLQTEGLDVYSCVWLRDISALTKLVEQHPLCFEDLPPCKAGRKRDPTIPHVLHYALLTHCEAMIEILTKAGARARFGDIWVLLRQDTSLRRYPTIMNVIRKFPELGLCTGPDEKTDIFQLVYNRLPSETYKDKSSDNRYDLAIMMKMVDVGAWIYRMPDTIETALHKMIDLFTANIEHPNESFQKEVNRVLESADVSFFQGCTRLADKLFGLLQHVVKIRSERDKPALLCPGIPIKLYSHSVEKKVPWAAHLADQIVLAKLSDRGCTAMAGSCKRLTESGIDAFGRVDTSVRVEATAAVYEDGKVVVPPEEVVFTGGHHDGDMCLVTYLLRNRRVDLVENWIGWDEMVSDSTPDEEVKVDGEEGKAEQKVNTRAYYRGAVNFCIEYCLHQPEKDQRNSIVEIADQLIRRGARCNNPKYNTMPASTGQFKLYQEIMHKLDAAFKSFPGELLKLVAKICFAEASVSVANVIVSYDDRNLMHLIPMFVSHA